ncbi:MAG: cyclic nucleotide-binding domain-containing protein [Desulfobacula sp.]|jgi:hypothetical protein|nr:cyclic nucleotide-binding domain-containing protein [Desulfobacula sp.]
MGENLQDLVEFLLKVPLFSPVPPTQIDQIADLFKRETYQKDDIICRQGDPGDSMYVVRSGIVSVFKEIEGREIAGIRLGIAFGAGAARGWAHIGVLKVPEDVLLRKGAGMVIAVCIEPRSGGGREDIKAPGIKEMVSRTISIVHGSPSFRKRDMNIPMLGNRIMHQYATQHLDIDDLVITVHPKYLWVYEDVLLFEKIGAMREYSYVKNNPAVALRLDLRTAEKKYKKIYGAEPLEKDLHHFFFSAQSDSIDLSSENIGKGCDFMEKLTQYYCLFSLKNGG